MQQKTALIEIPECGAEWSRINPGNGAKAEKDTIASNRVFSLVVATNDLFQTYHLSCCLARFDILFESHALLLSPSFKALLSPRIELGNDWL